MKIGIMTPDNQRWDEFCERLEGPDGCDFKKDDKGKICWKCWGNKDKRYSIIVMKAMGLTKKEIADSLEFFENNGGFCDCEVLFNVDR